MDLVVGAVVGEILSEVVAQIKQTRAFKKELTKIKTTLEKIGPKINEVTELNKKLDLPDEELATITGLLEEMKELVVECSNIGKINVIGRSRHTKKLIDLDNKLFRFFQTEVQAILLRTSNETLRTSNEIWNAVSNPTSHAGGFLGSCSVPGIPEFIVGLDQHLAAVKCRLLKDETRVLVVSAPGGFGKTTLVKKLCYDNEIKGIFGDNILYVTVSKETTLQSIAQDLFKHFGISNVNFRSEEHAKNQIENLLKQKGSGKMLLLVLDDVWFESVIRHLQFQIQEFKILVTSRNAFPEFNSTYYLSLLNAEDAEDLFCHYAFASDEIHVSDNHLVNKMIESCKGMPLALTVVGASLCGQREIKWRAILKKWSEGRSIFDSHQQLLDCLQISIIALDELHKNCFLDLGLFPKDAQIAGATLMDMWVEVYRLDDEGIYASENLHDLKLRNLINLIPIWWYRKVAGPVEGHCSQYFVTQQDVLRELAIYMNTQEPKAKRKRLSMEIRNNNFPEWWAKQPVDARILCISIDGEFSSTWDDLNAPSVEVLILNIRSKKYALPPFIEKMSQLKVLIVTGYGAYYTQLDNLPVLGSLSKLRRIRFECVSVSTSNQAIFTLKTLKKLTFFGCEIGDGVTGSPYMLENLKELEISCCLGLKVLPARLFSSSIHLQKLIIIGCVELEALPIELGKLSNLEILGLHYCINLKESPESIGNLRKLVLDIYGCRRLEKSPMSLTKLKQPKNVTLNEKKSYLLKSLL